MNGTIEWQRYPSDWLQVIADTIIRKDLRIDINSTLLLDSATTEIMQETGICHGLKDHWGTFVSEYGDESFVCEPYGEQLEEAEKFSDVFGLMMIDGELPAWNKSCNRYRFLPKNDPYPNAVLFLCEMIEAYDYEFLHHCKAMDEIKRLDQMLALKCGGKLYAFHQQSDGGIDFIGEAVGRSPDNDSSLVLNTIKDHDDLLTLSILDAVMATGCGLWCPSGEFRNVRRSECKVFTDQVKCLQEMLGINNRLYRKVKRDDNYM